MALRNDIYEDFLVECGEDEPGYEKSYFNGWDRCRSEVFNILNSLHSVPNTKVSLNEILTLMKEKL